MYVRDAVVQIGTSFARDGDQLKGTEIYLAVKLLWGKRWELKTAPWQRVSVNQSQPVCCANEL